MAAKKAGNSTGTKKTTAETKSTPKKTANAKKTTEKKTATTEKKTTEKKAEKKQERKPAEQPKTKSGRKSGKKAAEPVVEVQEPVKEELIPEFNNEVVLLITLVVSVLLFLSNFELSGAVGDVINQVTFGLFGVLAYIIPIFLFFGIAFYLANRKQNKRYIPKLIASIALFAVIAGIVQLVFGKTGDMELLEYYHASSALKNGGGLLGGVFCYLFVPAFGKVGSYVVLVALALFCVMILTGKALFAVIGEVSGRKLEEHREERRVREEERKALEEQEEDEEPEEDEFGEVLRSNKAKSFLLKNEEPKEVPKEKPEKNFFGGFSRTVPEGQKKEQAKQAAMQPVEKKPLDKETEEILYTSNYHMSKDNVETVNSIYEEEMRKKFDRAAKAEGIREITGEKKVQPSPVKVPVTAQTSLPKPAPEEPFEPSFSEQALSDRRRMEGGVREKTIFEHTPYGMPSKNNSSTEVEQEKPPANATVSELTKEEKKANQASVADIAQIAAAAEEAREEPVPQYQFPPIELLNPPEKRNVENNEDELQATADKLRETLHSFGVTVTINNYSRGPAVTRYELQPEQGVKVSRITSLADDIKLNLAAADIRIEAPIPGKAAVGIEVPNKENTAVLLRELVETRDFNEHSSNLAFTVGKDIGGQCIVADIAKMPHLLIAGATGSGKSVCINTIIMSILYKAHPDDVKLLMVDPKVVELSVYNGIPHLLIPVVTDPKKASAALNWAVAEMEERYAKFYELNARDLKGYNERVTEVEKEGHTDAKYPKYPQLVIIVDELADLMMVASGDVENAICRLAQKARAAGIHLILATQRPSVNVITGLIKANVPSRIAFAVSSGIDSRTILDSVGAEKLLGKGDMLFYPSGYPKPVRIQGAFVSDREVTRVVEFLKGQNGGPATYNEDITNKITAGAGNGSEAGAGTAGAGAASGRDEYFAEAGRFVIEKEKASISLLQRVYKIGFNRAARIMDQLEEAGVVSSEGENKARVILMSAGEFENFLNS